MNKNSGIYKITSPTNKIYIGQTVNFYKRISFYKHCRCKYQKKLYNSIIKYGWGNHKFEIIEECSIELLNNRERYWQDYYNVLEDGLNLKLTKTEDKSGYWSEEAKQKFKASKSNYPLITIEQRKNLANKKSKYSEEQRVNIWNKIQNNVNLIDIQKEYSDFTYNMYNAVIKGSSWNLITNLKKYVKGDSLKNDLKTIKKVICTETNTIYNSSKEAYLMLYKDKFSYSYFKCMLSGHNKNITTLKYYLLTD